MGKKVLTLSLILFTITSVYAQKNQVQIARNAVGKLQVSFADPSLKAKSLGFINDGLKAINLAKQNKKTGKWSETWAIKAYLHSCNALISANDEASDKQLNLALTSLDTAKMYDKDQLYSTLISATINNTMIRKLDKGNKAFEENDFLNAYQTLKEVSDYSVKDTSLALNVAIVAQNIQQDKEGLRYLMRAKEHGIRNPAVFQQLSKVYSLKFEPQQALRVLKEGIELNPDNAVLKRDYINVLLDNQKYTEALDALESELLVTRNDEKLFFIYGLLNQLEKRIPDAEAAFKRSIALNAYNFDAFYQLGLVYLDKANMQAKKSDIGYKEAVNNAELAFNKAYTIKPNDKATITLLIALYQSQSDLERVRELQRRLREF